jgi:hypothetical protein
MSRRSKEEGESRGGEGGLWINVIKCTLRKNNCRIIEKQECKKKKSATDDLTNDLTDIKTKGQGEYEKEKCICNKKASYPLHPSPLSLFEP